MALTWNEKLQNELIREFGNKNGSLLAKKYAKAFPAGYTDDYPVEAAIKDIPYIEKLSAENPLEINFYISAEKSEYPIHLRLFQWKKPIPLSDILPMLENLDLKANSERPHKITLQGEPLIWISDFSVSYSYNPFKIEAVKELFQDAFKAIYFNLCESDGFNKLVLGASLSWQDIVILRAYAKYLRQIGFRFSQTYIETTLAKNAATANKLVAIFKKMHDPFNQTKNKESLVNQIEKQIQVDLELVTSLDEDKILRTILELIQATLRTNYFQLADHDKPKEYLSLKLKSHSIADLPLPIPLYEVFVYSPRFEAIHLRNTKVARGGIRWSERREDFRTEILGLMKAQTVKNALIVPSGAKGGFVLKMLPSQATREETQKEVIYCYQSFIRGLLDITDNIQDKKTLHPLNVVCYDDFDPYLVVAADKGTASFSDIANAISNDYHFWLGDAFASGGSTGYDHKKMGITARGAWESIKRHFRELNVDVLTTTITVIGIGDMSGDVFGNGMLYSKRIKLVAAFDHRHIFIDPDPDANISYKERLRLFRLPNSSWEDYNSKLISKGGGVFKRSVKSITLSSQMQALLATDAKTLMPNELIRAVLKAPVNLLFNGGIGTYVKSSLESNAEVGDRTNDYCRVNGDELRCQVVGEGGNLGFTQRGRIEYALKGGLINTDFIDNSGGVDCSDHEVNLKILLDPEVKKGRLTFNTRNELLASLTDSVASLVLNDNYSQALVLSFSAYHANRNVGLHLNYMKELESQGVLNKKMEFLPDDKVMAERKAAGIGLTRPELAVLLAYSKIYLKAEILKTNLTEDSYLKEIIATAFPPHLYKKYKNIMYDHRLHRDIISTQLSNQLINQMGFTYVYRVQMETGATIEEIIRAYTVSSQVFDTLGLQNSIEELDFKIPLSEQYDMLFNVRNLINLATRWFLHRNYLKQDLRSLIKEFGEPVAKLENLIPQLMSGYTKQYSNALVEKFAKEGLPKELAERIAGYRAMYTALAITDIALHNHFDLIKTAKVYFLAGEHISLVWFRDQIAADLREGHWNILSRLTLRDELDICQRAFTVAVMKKDKKNLPPLALIELWRDNNPRALHRWEKLLEMMHSSNQIEYNMIFIAMRELLGLIVTSQ